MVALAALILAVYPVPVWAGHPLDQLQPRHWYEVPNSTLRAVAPDPLPRGWANFGILAYSGGAFDTTRNRLLTWGRRARRLYG